MHGCFAYPTEHLYLLSWRYRKTLFPIFDLYVVKETFQPIFDPIRFPHCTVVRLGENLNILFHLSADLQNVTNLADTLVWKTRRKNKHSDICHGGKSWISNLFGVIFLTFCYCVCAGNLQNSYCPSGTLVRKTANFQTQSLVWPLWICMSGQLVNNHNRTVGIHIKTYLVAILFCFIVAPTENTLATWNILRIKSIIRCLHIVDILRSPQQAGIFISQKVTTDVIFIIILSS